MSLSVRWNLSHMVSGKSCGVAILLWLLFFLLLIWNSCTLLIHLIWHLSYWEQMGGVWEEQSNKTSLLQSLCVCGDVEGVFSHRPDWSAQEKHWLNSTAWIRLYSSLNPKDRNWVFNSRKISNFHSKAFTVCVAAKTTSRIILEQI